MMDAILKYATVPVVLDVALVSVLLYWLMLMFKGTRAEKMIWGIAVLAIMNFVSLKVELLTLHWILSNFLGSFVIFIIVVFQQDIRRALVQMGRTFSMSEAHESAGHVEEIVRAAHALAQTRTGAIIAMERSVDVADLAPSGVELDARISKGLLLALFNAHSPLHDGAVVIRRERIYKAGSILPLTDREVDRPLGTRHRAAIGLTDETDAVVVVVSEETGDVTLVVDGECHRGLSHEELTSRIKELMRQKTEVSSGLRALFAWKTTR